MPPGPAYSILLEDLRCPLVRHPACPRFFALNLHTLASRSCQTTIWDGISWNGYALDV